MTREDQLERMLRALLARVGGEVTIRAEELHDGADTVITVTPVPGAMIVRRETPDAAAIRAAAARSLDVPR